MSGNVGRQGVTICVILTNNLKSRAIFDLLNLIVLKHGVALVEVVRYFVFCQLVTFS